MNVFSLYEKYKEERERYRKFYEKYGKFYNITISYGKNNNSINYISNKGTADEERLVVKYSPDGKIADVLAYTGVEEYKKWSSLTKLLNNLGSGKFYYDFSSSYNPFSHVAPSHMSSYKNEGMFDIMMQITNEYIKQTDQNVTLAVSYEGYGWANSPVSKIIYGKDAQINPLDMTHRTEIYNPDVLYALEYYEKEEKTHDFLSSEPDLLEEEPEKE